MAGSSLPAAPEDV